MGYVVLVMALRVADDTKMLTKTMVSELAENLEELVRNRCGRHVVLDLLASIAVGICLSRSKDTWTRGRWR